ncbi:MAG: hypothetical protein DRG58_05560 [Deltaproteobacteria bacterium]|nr:MAG: hypothetical protein DRG58_05560 [Deltaproteobacteria bacterium]
MAELILVGTVHGDPQGYQRVWKCLECWRPSLITVEISQFSLRYRQRHGPAWRRQFQRTIKQMPPGARQHLALRRIEAQLAWPFEAQATQDYVQQHDIGWRAIDTGRLSRNQLRRYLSELLTPKNLHNLLLTEDGDWGQYIGAEYHQARLALAHPQRFALQCRYLWISEPMLRRDRIMARRLRALAQVASPIVHLGGWTHLLTDVGPTTLAQHLVDLKPQRWLLDQF